MDIRSFFSALVMLACPFAANALSCEPGPLFELGDHASYRFTESNAAPVDVSVTAVQQTDFELVFSIQEGGVSYQVSYLLSCGFEFLGGQESDLVAPLYSNFYRVTEILDLDPWVFGSSNPAAHINRVSNSCTRDEFTTVEFCTTRYGPEAENGVVEVQTTFKRDFDDDPINQLLTKTQRYADGRIDTIERIDTAAGENPHNIPGTPQNLQALVYSNSSAELLWQRADAAERIVAYEVRRGGELLADIDGTSYFDGNREPGQEYLYSVTAIRDDGQRSAAATIIATAFGGIDPSSEELFLSLIHI